MLWPIIYIIILPAALTIIYNLLVIGRQRVKSAWSQIDVQLKRRHDLIPNLITVAKGYMQHEHEIMEEVATARQIAAGASSIKDKEAAENVLSNALHSFFAVAENYPRLKADRVMLSLHEELVSTENRIAFARQYYNEEVLRYNTRVETFPSSAVAKLFGFTRKEFFKIEATGDRQAITAGF